jgi:hypothetical protein
MAETVYMQVNRTLTTLDIACINIENVGTMAIVDCLKVVDMIDVVARRRMHRCRSIGR